MNDFMTLAFLGTFAGAVIATLLIVQYFKPLLPKLDTRLFAFLVALVVMIGVTTATNGSLTDYGLAVINSVLIASSAMGAYQVTFEKSDIAKKEEKIE